MRTLPALAASFQLLALLSSCCCSGGSSATTAHQRQQMKANNLQTLNAGTAATLSGD